VPTGGYYLEANAGADSVEADLVTQGGYEIDPQSEYCPPLGGPTETAFLQLLARELAQPSTDPAGPRRPGGSSGDFEPLPIEVAARDLGGVAALT
jgi:hypothetical protein